VFSSVIVAIALGVLFSRGIARRFQTIIDNSYRLAIGEPLRARIGGTDEFALVDESFHKMAVEIRAATRRERAMLENAVDIICGIDPDLRFIEVSPSVEAVLGYTVDELRGRRLVELLAPGDGERIVQAIKSTVNQETSLKLAQIRTVSQSIAAETTLKLETQMLRKNGTVVDMLWAGTWSVADRTFVCVMHDVSEQKAAERLRQELVQMVTHDLRTPLTTISTYLELLHSRGIIDNAPDRLQKVHAAAERSATNMMSLIRDLLDLDRLHTGILKLHKKQVPLTEVFENSIVSVVGLAEEKSAIIEAENTKLCAFGDQDRLGQIVINLLARCD
jgi:PAS domain S-box-containing protein